MSKAQLNQKPILIGMTGGIESTVAAYLLKKQGHKVIDALFHIHDPHFTSSCY